MNIYDRDTSDTSTDTDTDTDTYNKYSSYDEYQYKGEIIGHKYLLIHIIGQGAFSIVWLALNLSDKKYYVIKMQNVEDDVEAEEEIEIMKKMKNKCKYINQMIESFEYNIEDDVHFCMVFELMVGSLYDIMKNDKYKNGFSVKIVYRIMLQLLTAVNFVHNDMKIVHTDLKPDNVLVCGRNNKIIDIIKYFEKQKDVSSVLSKKIKPIGRKKLTSCLKRLEFSDIEKKYSNKSIEFVGEECVENIDIKLSDFGSYRDLDYDAYDLQTRYYRSPEIILHMDSGINIDMWSIGCIFHEMLTGKMLFDPIKLKHGRFYGDRAHLWEMFSKLGCIPSTMLHQSKRYDYYFTQNGLIKGSQTFHYNLIYDQLVEEYGKNIIDLTFECLNYDYKKRITSKDALSRLKSFISNP